MTDLSKIRFYKIEKINSSLNGFEFLLRINGFPFGYFKSRKDAENAFEKFAIFFKEQGIEIIEEKRG